MTQNTRQSELFAAQDWQVLYQAFTQINFNASDPVSINTALVEYVRNNYSENFNDWIESSEFVQIIDLLSWLAGTLAFKTDINARENFLDSAEAKQSVLRLARFLSYNPTRNQPLTGSLKIMAIQTDDDTYDSFGNNLANTTILWNDSSNSNWYEQFISVLNNAFVSSNPFGVPLVNANTNGLKNQLYRLNATFGANQSALSFSPQTSTLASNFEIVNPDYSVTNGFFERSPDPSNALNIIYLNDGLGSASAQTGFFLPFKQGKSASQLFNISTPVENQTLDINVDQINNSDVWVQTVNDSKAVLYSWTPVPFVLGENITFNSLPVSERNIYSVVTRENDQITLRFSDGRFGNAPVGLIRVTYRTSDSTQTQIRPTDIQFQTIAFTYTNAQGSARSLKMSVSLQQSVANSAPSETTDQIRARAPVLYATQNRMVSGEDYNTFPLRTNLATKIKALTRMYSGQSRYIDLNDPTGNYSNTVVLADDGIFYKQPYNSYVEMLLSENKSTAEMITSFIQPSLTTDSAENFIKDQFQKLISNGVISFSNLNLVWYQSTNGSGYSTGYFNTDSLYLRSGAYVKFQLPDSSFRWCVVTNLNGTTTAVPYGTSDGPVILSKVIPSHSTVVKILPKYASTFSSTFFTTLQAQLATLTSFNIWYDPHTSDETQYWTIVSTNLIPVSTTAILMVRCTYSNSKIWTFQTAGMRYGFESISKVQFYYDGGNSATIQNGQSQHDTIRILSLNSNLNSNNQPFNRDYDLYLSQTIEYANGYTDQNKIEISFKNPLNSNFADDPDLYQILTTSNNVNTYLFWQQSSDGSFVPYSGVKVYETESIRLLDFTNTDQTVAFQIASATNPNSFWIWNQASQVWNPDYKTFAWGQGRGPNVASTWVEANGQTLTPVGSTLKYQWNHYALSDRRIDPSRSNLIDIYVLLTSYDYNMRIWVANGAQVSLQPSSPTELDISNAFASTTDYKMFSDDVVWHPVVYKFLFGQTADPELQAQFKVVKLNSTTLSNGEIQSRVLSTIAAYFSSSLWDFGQTFYYSELAAAIHTGLSGIIASVVIVPTSSNGVFGDMFEVSCRPDQMFLSTATISDIIIIDSNTAQNLRIGN